jgi:alpha-galactosidase
VLDARGSGVPTILHWGRDLGDASVERLVHFADASIPAIAHSAVGVPLQLSVLPLLDQAWQGHPGLDGTPRSSPFSLTRTTATATSLQLSLESETLRAVLDYELTEEGLLRARATLTNVASEPFQLGELNLTVPLPGRAVEVLDFTGRWAAERRPQRRRIADGAWSRETRHGRSGHDAPYVVVAGTEGFTFRTGEVWGLHLAWSGNQRLWAEHLSSGASAAGAGELLAAGELSLAEGESYTTPWLVGSWSDQGLDGMSDRFHRYIRRTTGSDRRAHPLILNTWEAVYFDHNDEALRELARLGAEVGVERFVLDDGWMTGRTDDTRGLGDWTVDPDRRPEGLGPLAHYVVDLGMEFGLWVEPEMLTLDSEVARSHPDWILADPPGVLPLPARHQFVLDLGNPDAWDHVLAQLDALLTECPIACLKWDHNRDLLTPAVHRQTVALYRLMAELKSRHPAVEIESCASGGGRIDLAILESVVRVWPSDNNDSLERQSIYRWTTLLIPPELFGAHVGAPTSHTTGRTHTLPYRLATALFGWAGIEWDLRDASADDLLAIADWVAAYKRLRGLLHSGTVVRADREDSLWVHGIVSRDGAEAVFSISALAMTDDAIPSSIRLPGLDPARTYAIEPITLGAPPRYLAQSKPGWLETGGTVILGRLLEQVGIAAPPLAPEQTLILHLRAVS